MHTYDPNPFFVTNLPETILFVLFPLKVMVGTFLSMVIVLLLARHVVTQCASNYAMSKLVVIFYSYWHLFFIVELLDKYEVGSLIKKKFLSLSTLVSWRLKTNTPLGDKAQDKRSYLEQ